LPLKTVSISGEHYGALGVGIVLVVSVGDCHGPSGLAMTERVGVDSRKRKVSKILMVDD
jgi:hypothetical protein